MACDIEYDSKAVKQLQKLNPFIARELLEAIEEFANTPILTKIKKLKTPFDRAFRLRIGDYRVILYQEESLVLISKIVYRKEVPKLKSFIFALLRVKLRVGNSDKIHTFFFLVSPPIYSK